MAYISTDSIGNTTIVHGQSATHEMHVYADSPGSGYILQKNGDDSVSYYIFNNGLTGNVNNYATIWAGRAGFTYAPFHVANQTLHNGQIIT